MRNLAIMCFFLSSLATVTNLAGQTPLDTSIVLPERLEPDWLIIGDITNSAQLISPEKYPAIKRQYNLTTINNKSFGMLLGGLDPAVTITSAIKFSDQEEGLYALDCENQAKLNLVLEEGGQFTRIKSHADLRARFGPVESPQKAVTFAHLLEGGLPATFFADIEEFAHVERIDDQHYQVKLIVSDPCDAHGERSINTYLVDVMGNVQKTASESL